MIKRREKNGLTTPSDWKEHPLMTYETVQRWMRAKSENKPSYRIQALISLQRYCAFRKMNPDQLIDEWLKARQSESAVERLKPEDELNKWRAFLTDNGTRATFMGAAQLRIVKPFFKANGCAISIEVEMPRAPAHEQTTRATAELTRQFVDEARKVEHKWAIICMAESGMRPGSVCQLQYKHIMNSYEKNETPLCIEVPGKITKTGQKYYAFVLDDAKEILRMLLEHKKRLGEEITSEMYLTKLDTKRLIHFVTEISIKIGVNPERGLKHFTTGSWREYVQNRLEASGIVPNRVSLLLGAQPSGRDAHYSNPPREELAKEYMKASNELIVYGQMLGKVIQKGPTPEQVREIFEKLLTELLTKSGATANLPALKNEFRQLIASSLVEQEIEAMKKSR